MKVITIIRLLTILVFFNVVHFIYPQTDQYKFENITSLDGLSGNRIYTILQDSRDFVWIGTDRGLNCFNGYEIFWFDRPKDPIKLSQTWVSCLYEDIRGIIWIGTNSNGLYVYDPTLDRFNHYLHDPYDSSSIASNRILSIYQDKNDVIWIGTDGGGLNRYNAVTKTFTAFTPFPGQAENKTHTISSMIEDNEGTFWIGTLQGIYHFNRNDKKFLPFEKRLNIPEIYQQILCLHQDTDGYVWIGTLKGLFKYTVEESELIHVISTNDENNDHLRDDVIVSIQESNIAGKPILWIATRNGLIKYDRYNDKFTRFTIDPKTHESLSNNSINALCLNDGGVLWIGTAWSGVNKINTGGNPFKHVLLKSEDEGLFYSANSFFMDKKGYLWVGACTGGLFKFDSQIKEIGQYQYSTKKGFFIDAGTPFTNWIDCIYEDSGGNLWMGLGGLGSAIFDREKETFIYVDFHPPEGYSHPERIEDILQDHSGTIWYAGNGLFKKEKTENLYDPINSINNELIQQSTFFDIFEDSEENIYFGTAGNGLFCLKHNDRASMKFTHYGSTVSKSPGLNKSSIYKITEDINGIIWAASNRGLNRFNPESQQFELVNDTTGTFDGGVSQVFGDKEENLWLNHRTKGLVKYQPDKRSVKIFDSKDGLPFDNIVPRYWYQSEDGRIFIGGYLGDGNGFFYFHPDSITDNMNIPEIVITDLKVKNNLFPVDSSISTIKHINLKYNQNFFSFQFAALDYSNLEKNQYAYYLDGLEDDWIYSGNQRFANYTGIPPGKYIFRVKGSNNDGYWNEEGASIAITILPPPWKTWWAYSIYTLLFVGLFYAWRRYDLKRQHLKQQLEIEYVEAEKLKELDTMKSRFFANISHEFRTPLTLILGPLQKVFSKTSDEETKQNLNMMQRNALRLQNLINQLLNLSKLESGKMKLQAREENIVVLVNGYVQSFESLAKQKKIDLNFKSAEENIPLFVDKEKIEKILFNLLSNAFKFTEEGGEIEVSITTLPLRQMGEDQNPPALKANATKISLFRGDKMEVQTPPFIKGVGGIYDREIQIIISDTGRGIPSGQLPNIFDRFYQADDSYSKDQEGTGIGLALTKELVKLHHGTIRVESHPGEGSVFTVFLPAGKLHLKPDEIADKPEISAEREKFQKSIPEHEFSENILTGEGLPNEDEFNEKDDKPYVLIVDDNADLRSYMRECLTEDYYILEATEGMEGFNKAIEKIPDLIISDVMMPKMDGNELCKKLKTDERTSHIPVILLTARASSESRIEGLETGADDFITKPFDHLELLIRIKNLIQQRSKLKEKFRTEIEYHRISKSQSVISMDQQFIRKAKTVVEKNISEPEFSIEKFAGEMALSRVQLHRKLRALVGQSATQFIRTIKLNRAAGLLKNKSGTVSEIAYDVGFNTLPYFTKCFHEQFGVNPSEFGN